MIRLNVARIGKYSRIDYQKVSNKNFDFAKNFTKEVIKTISPQTAQELEITVEDKPIRRFLRKMVEMSIDDMKLKFNILMKKGASDAETTSIDGFLTGEEFNKLSKGVKTSQKNGFRAEIISALEKLRK